MKAPTHPTGILHKATEPGAKGFNQRRIASLRNNLDGFLIDRFQAAIKPFMDVTIGLSADEALFYIKDHQVGNRHRVMAGFLKIIDRLARCPQIEPWKAARRVKFRTNGFAIRFSQFIEIDRQQARRQEDFVVSVEFIEFLKQRQQLMMICSRGNRMG